MQPDQPSAFAHTALHIEDLHIQQSTALATLQLTAYAIDAMRVLQTLDHRARQSPPTAAALTHACRDWRNPASLHDPMDTVALVLSHTVQTMQSLMTQTGEAIKALLPQLAMSIKASAQTPTPAPPAS